MKDKWKKCPILGIYFALSQYTPNKNSLGEHLRDIKYKMNLHRYEGKENERGMGLKSKSFILRSLHMTHFILVTWYKSNVNVHVYIDKLTKVIGNFYAIPTSHYLLLEIWQSGKSSAVLKMQRIIVGTKIPRLVKNLNSHHSEWYYPPPFRVAVYCQRSPNSIYHRWWVKFDYFSQFLMVQNP